MRRAVATGAVEGTAFDLDAYMEEERPRVDAALREAVARWTPGVAPRLADAVAHGVLSGGKRLRPILCVAGYRACGGSAGDLAYDLAASLELIHAYSLMHDDLPCMDDAPLRRGRPSTHAVHGVEATVWAGAALIPMAALQALAACADMGLDRGRTHAVLSALLAAAGGGGMVGGQLLDLLGEGKALAPDELDRLHGLKTGALLTASLVMGAHAARAPDDVVEALRRFGASIGLAFQIADDVLDATSTAETLGKRPSDSDLDKSTYVSLYGLEEARRRAEREIDAAHEALRSVGIEARPLHALATYVVARTH